MTPLAFLHRIRGIRSQPNTFGLGTVQYRLNPVPKADLWAPEELPFFRSLA